MPKVFISYRRAVSAYQAGRLYDRLVSVYGKENVFLDVEKIPIGETFESYILKKIDESDIFLALLANGTLNRIHNENDLVRHEIAYALDKQAIRVVPVLVDGFPMPKPEDLPHDIRGLTERNAALLLHQLFDESVARVTDSIDREWETLKLPINKDNKFVGCLKSNIWQGIGGIVGILALIITIMSVFPLPVTLDNMPTEIAQATHVLLTLTNTPTLTMIPSDTPTPTNTSEPKPLESPTQILDQLKASNVVVKRSSYYVDLYQTPCSSEYERDPLVNLVLYGYTNTVDDGQIWLLVKKAQDSNEFYWVRMGIEDRQVTLWSQSDYRVEYRVVPYVPPSPETYSCG